jgi:hypothetical protein
MRCVSSLIPCGVGEQGPFGKGTVKGVRGMTLNFLWEWNAIELSSGLSIVVSHHISKYGNKISQTVSFYICGIQFEPGKDMYDYVNCVTKLLRCVHMIVSHVLFPQVLTSLNNLESPPRLSVALASCRTFRLVEREAIYWRILFYRR